MAVQHGKLCRRGHAPSIGSFSGNGNAMNFMSIGEQKHMNITFHFCPLDPSKSCTLDPYWKWNWQIGKLANGTKWCILVTHLLCMLHFTAALLSVKTLNYQHPKTLPLKGKIPNPPPSLNNYPNNHIVFYWRPPVKPLIWCEMWIPAHLRLNEGWIICHLIWGKQLLVILKQAAQR